MTRSLRTRTADLDTRTRGVLLQLLLAAIALLSLAAAAAAIVQPVNQLTQPGGSVPVELTEAAQREAMENVTGLPSGTWLELASGSMPVVLHAQSLTWPVQMSAFLSLTWAFAGICALAFAEAFAHGRALSDDVDGLV